MGYTHYWEVNKTVTPEEWKNYKAFVRKAIELIDGTRWSNCAAGDNRDTPIDEILQVNIRGGDGTGAPYVAPDETDLVNEETTAGVDTDNEPMVEDIIWLNGDAADDLDNETFYVSLDDTGFNFCKTARKPYDTIVLACVIAGEKMGVFKSWSSDASSRDEMRSGFALYYKTLENL